MGESILNPVADVSENFHGNVTKEFPKRAGINPLNLSFPVPSTPV
jgi:hypothetical protein